MSTDKTAARLHQPVIPDSVSAIRRAKTAGPPAATGWYWIEDDELIEGNPWCLAWVNLLGDDYSHGKPLMVTHDMDRNRPGRADSWKFFWDGEDWICPGDASAVTVPLRFVPVSVPG